jgi:hypothetical protein
MPTVELDAQFERICRWFLKNDPTNKVMLRHVLVESAWGAVPMLPSVRFPTPLPKVRGKTAAPRCHVT